MDVHGKIASDLAGFGGVLRCTVHGGEMPLGDVADKLANGWPKCCGYTMRWVTARELAAEGAGSGEEATNGT